MSPSLPTPSLRPDGSAPGASPVSNIPIEVRAALKRARRRVFDALVALSSVGLATPDDEEAVRQLVRRGRELRLATPASLQAAAHACDRLARKFEERRGAVPPAAGPVETAGAAVVKREPPRKPRTVRRRTLNSVPAAGTDPGDARASGAEVPRLAMTEIAEDPELVAEIAMRMQLVALMDAGRSAAEALQQMELPASRLRFAQRLFKKWKADGTVIDGRWARRAQRHVMVPQLEAIVLRAWNGRRGASLAAVHRMVCEEVRRRRREAAERGVPCEVEEPSYEAVKKYIRDLPPALQLVRDESLEAWDKNARMVVTYDPTRFANEMWQIDHTRLDIWVRVEVAPGEWEPRQVWLTAAFDVHSRAVMGWSLSRKHPDAWTTALVMRSAVLEKKDPALPVCGLPETLVPDHGKDFMSHSVAALMRALGVRLDPCPPNYPNMKGEVERWFGTLNGYLAQLVGFMQGDGRSEGAARLRLPYLLTVPQLRAEVTRFIAEYHDRRHSVTRERPLERWQRTVQLSMPPAPEDLNVLMLKSDQTRRVTKEGISFTVDGTGGKYLAYELLHYWRQEVRIRYNPEDLESVLVYAEATGEFLCEAWLEGTRYDVDDVKRWRSGFRQELKKRTTAYVKEVEEDDRRSARARDEAFARARQMQARDVEHRPAAPPAAPLEPPVPPEADPKGIESLLQRFRQRDRGRASGLPAVIQVVSSEAAGEEEVA